MIFIVAILVVLFFVGNSANAKQFLNKEECKLHKWEYVNNELECSVCKNKPGYTARE